MLPRLIDLLPFSSWLNISMSTAYLKINSSSVISDASSPGKCLWKTVSI
jgi:hypothetical protein